jgi:hypothetical protein
MGIIRSSLRFTLCKHTLCLIPRKHASALMPPIFASLSLPAHGGVCGSVIGCTVQNNDESDRLVRQPRRCRTGAANGVLTKGLLTRMRADAHLDAYEINPRFLQQLGAINDRRLQVVAASAEQLLRPYDAIFSCLPLLSLPVRVVTRIMRQIHQSLSPQEPIFSFNTARCQRNYCRVISTGNASWW